MSPATPLLRPRGDYQRLFSYQKADVIYQITCRFCDKHLQPGDRTVDQMVQAARSGKQNIIEGNKAGAASKEMELRLTTVARASLEELLEDYRDYLKRHDLLAWEKQSHEAIYVRKLGTKSLLTFEAFRDFVETRPAAVVANIAICLICQANYLLDRQIGRLEREFLEDGGMRERMRTARLQARDSASDRRWK